MSVLFQPVSAALTSIRAALGFIWRDVFTTAVCNLLWWVCQVLLIPGPPATLALFYYAHRTVRGEVTDVQDFWVGLRRYWRLGWRWGVINLVVVLLLVGDYFLTGRLGDSNPVRWMQGLYVALLLGWVWLQVFALAFLFEQESFSLRMSLRNAAVMIGQNPLYSATWLAGVTGVLILGVLAFMLSGAFGTVFIAFAGALAVQMRLEAYRASQRRSNAPSAPSSKSDFAA